MTIPLPNVFAMSGSRDRWLVVSPGDHLMSSGRTLERRIVRAADWLESNEAPTARSAPLPPARRARRISIAEGRLNKFPLRGRKPKQPSARAFCSPDRSPKRRFRAFDITRKSTQALEAARRFAYYGNLELTFATISAKSGNPHSADGGRNSHSTNQNRPLQHRWNLTTLVPFNVVTPSEGMPNGQQQKPK